MWNNLNIILKDSFCGEEVIVIVTICYSLICYVSINSLKLEDKNSQSVSDKPRTQCYN